MEQRSVNATARRRANHERARNGPTMAVAERRRRVDDLVEGARDEIRELHLEYRPHPQNRSANPSADDERLGNRRIDYAVLAERGEQAVGDLERAAEFADVLAHDEDVFVAPHLFVQCLVNRGQVGDFHPMPSRSGLAVTRSVEAGRIQILERLVRFGQRTLFGEIDRLLHDLPRTLVDFFADTLYVVAFFFEIELEARNRDAALPFPEFFLIAI